MSERFEINEELLRQQFLDQSLFSMQKEEGIEKEVAKLREILAPILLKNCIFSNEWVESLVVTKNKKQRSVLFATSQSEN